MKAIRVRLRASDRRPPLDPLPPLPRLRDRLPLWLRRLARRIARGY